MKALELLIHSTGTFLHRLLRFNTTLRWVQSLTQIYLLTIRNYWYSFSSKPYLRLLLTKHICNSSSDLECRTSYLQPTNPQRMTPTISQGDTDSAVSLISFADTYLTGSGGSRGHKMHLHTIQNVCSKKGCLGTSIVVLKMAVSVQSDSNMIYDHNHQKSFQDTKRCSVYLEILCHTWLFNFYLMMYSW